MCMMNLVTEIFLTLDSGCWCAKFLIHYVIKHTPVQHAEGMRAVQVLLQEQS